MMAARLMSDVTRIDYRGRRFLLTASPSNDNIDTFLGILSNEHCTHLVRACEPTYVIEQASERNVTVYDLVFPDGGTPSDDIVAQWLHLLALTAAKEKKAEKEKVKTSPSSSSLTKDKTKLASPKPESKTTTSSSSSSLRHIDNNNNSSSSSSSNHANSQTIAVHCAAGLGRAPVLIAIAMIEMGCPYDEAVQRIRRKRVGCFNAKQLHFLEAYRPRGTASSCHCVIL